MGRNILITFILILLFVMAIYFYINSRIEIEGAKIQNVNVLKFKEGSLNSIKINGDDSQVNSLSLPSNTDFNDIGEYRYLANGIEYDLGDNIILGFKCIFYDYWNLGYGAANITLVYNDKKWEINKNTTEKELLYILGPPNETSSQNDLKVLYYYFDDFQYEIDILKNGKISHIHADSRI